MVSFGTIIVDAAVTALTAAQESHRAHNNSRAAFDRDQYSNAAPAYFDGVIPFIKQTIYIFFMICVLFVTSLITYSVLYCVIVPPNYARKPIYFDYNFRGDSSYVTGASRPCVVDCLETRENERNLENNTCLEGKRVIDDTIDMEREECDTTQQRQEHQSIKDKLVSNEARNAQQNREIHPPTAIVDLFSTHTQWRAFIPDIASPSMASKSLDPKSQPRILSPKKPYFVDVALTLPESESNRQLGMFMVEVDLRDAKGTIMASSSRSTMLPYESNMVSVIRKSILMGPLLLGAIPEARTVILKCFDHFVEHVDRPLASVEVRIIVPKLAQFHSTFRSIQVLEAELRIGKELNLIQTIMKEYFYSCALICIFIFMVAQAISIFLLQAFYDTIHAAKVQAEENNYFDHGGDMFMNPNTGEELEKDLNEDEVKRKNGSEDMDRHLSSDFDDDSNVQWEETRKNECNDDLNRCDDYVSSPDLSEEFSAKNCNPVLKDDLKRDVGADSTHLADSSTADGENNISHHPDSKGIHGFGAGADEKKILQKKKIKKVSITKEELKQQNSADRERTMELSSKEEERIKVEKVMKGDFERYEIFTGKKSADIECVD